MKEKQKKRDSAGLRFLYGTFVGRAVLSLLTKRGISKMCGAFLDSRLSRGLIRGFVEKNAIDLGECENTDFRCFNDCFTRKLRPELRLFSTNENDFCAPCDGLLSIYPITGNTVLPIKQSCYNIPSLLEDVELAERFRNGLCLVFRLCVNHYHRYAYVDNGVKGENVFIKGELHTVRPIALEQYPVFMRNCREYTVMETEHFGTMVQVEVGAMLVGRIQNHMGAGNFVRGTEKGMFLYGGSTIVVLLEPHRVTLCEELAAHVATGEEIPVRMGQTLGRADDGASGEKHDA